MGGQSAPASGELDANQLLAQCQRVRDTMGSLEQRIIASELNLTTLGYIHDQADILWLKCFDNLIELCKLSQSLVQQLELLQFKLEGRNWGRGGVLGGGGEESPVINKRIAGQQLAYFTSEWYENFRPKLNSTLELASERNIELAGGATGAVWAGQRGAGRGGRVRDALLRLRQSVAENERLLASIAADVEYSRSAIDSICGSLRSSQRGLAAGARNALGAAELIRLAARNWLLLGLLLLLGGAALAAYLLLLS